MQSKRKKQRNSNSNGKYRKLSLDVTQTKVADPKHTNFTIVAL